LCLRRCRDERFDVLLREVTIRRSSGDRSSNFYRTGESDYRVHEIAEKFVSQ
jgi:hypothetical protein